jgi:hypothetical protein
LLACVGRVPFPLDPVSSFQFPRAKYRNYSWYDYYSMRLKKVTFYKDCRKLEDITGFTIERELGELIIRMLVLVSVSINIYKSCVPLYLVSGILHTKRLSNILRFWRYHCPMSVVAGSL